MTMSDPSSNPHNRINLWAVAAIAGLLMILALMGIRLLQNDASPVRIGEKPKDFSLATYAGDVINTDDLRGKVILVNFWASWCTTCDEEAALLQAAWEHYQAVQPDQVIFLGVAYMDTEPASKAFLDQYGVRYPNGPDLRGEISKLYQVNSVPETFILDVDGTLRFAKIGAFTSLNQVLSAIDAALPLSLD
jgi:cytochrome c biogenesis protein CcmG, thiol:disulfide interchange protein DsbE